ncbi:MAG TPA: L-serine ammonia-lyase, iron-sulfur-dependent, subunit alpha [Bacteroidales bacterium]|nr:L-serine ammonia-lyase, iron-sulfur-dependent, subunit alpha [Bacteroidales bacterium]
MDKTKLKKKHLDFLNINLPEIYFKIMDKDDYKSHYQLIKKTLKPKNIDNVFHFKGDIEDFYSHSFCYDKLKSTLLKVAARVKGNIAVYRCFFNKSQNFILSASYKSIGLSERINEFQIPAEKTICRLFSNEDEKLIKNIDITIDTDFQAIVIQCVNIAFNTLLANILETFEKHGIELSFVSIIQVKKPFKNADKYYKVEIKTIEKIEETEFVSLSQDFERYIQTSIKAMSIFDMVGPSMVGPSSSHTAGANRIGQIARNTILAVTERGEIIKNVEVKLLGSFRDTGVGHKTPSALGGGLCGFGTDHPEMIAHGEPEFLKNKGIKFGKSTAIFIGYTKGSPADDLKYLSQRNNNIAEIHFSTNIANYFITGFSIGAGNVEIRFFNKELAKPINGKTDFRLDGAEIIESNDDKLPLIKKIFDEASVSEIPSLPFNTFEELIEYLTETGENLIKIICQTEYSLQKMSEKEVYEKMQLYWQVMKSSVYSGVKSRETSMLKLSGGDSKKMNEYLKTDTLFDNIYGKAAAYATAVNEINAKSGVIIACPTAGSCGILPGVLTAWSEQHPDAEKQILESLMVAGFFGMILFTDVSTAGADYGCQAEIGAAAAMAASALVYLEGGTYAQMIQAFALAIKNCLGLICDPVAGLVEVPCVKRNGIYSSLAITAAFMALSGVKSFISPDEVVLTMREVGERLHIDYKETGRAGLAKTRDGKQVERDFEEEVRRFFG